VKTFELKVKVDNEGEYHYEVDPRLCSRGKIPDRVAVARRNRETVACRFVLRSCNFASCKRACVGHVKEATLALKFK
jgi:hypothetical protein